MILSLFVLIKIRRTRDIFSFVQVTSEWFGHDHCHDKFTQNLQK